MGYQEPEPQDYSQTRRVGDMDYQLVQFGIGQLQEELQEPDEVAEFKEAVENHFAPDIKILDRRGDIKLNSGIIIGIMDSGKTSYTHYLFGRGQQILLERGVDDDYIVYIHTFSLPLDEVAKVLGSIVDLHRVRYVYWFNDDAITEGQDSRTSMSRENITSTQFYTNIRHNILEKAGFKGVLIVMHATQVYERIDKVYRGTNQIEIFKSWNTDVGSQKYLFIMLGGYFNDLKKISLDVARFGNSNWDKFVDAISKSVVKYMDKVMVIKPEIPVKSIVPINYVPLDSEKLGEYVMANTKMQADYEETVEKKPFEEIDVGDTHLGGLVQAKLPPELYEAFERAKEESGLDKAKLFRTMVAEGLKKHGYYGTPENGRQVA